MEKVGFVGLGIMGKPMALNLLKAGYSVSVLSKSAAAAELTESGATAYATNKELAAQCDVIITMLPDSPDVEQVVSGTDGVLEGIQSGALFIDMSTIAPATAVNIYKLMKAKEV